MSSDNPPIFIWPFARSGGTLFNTMLSTHPRLAMSYEIYQENLISDSGKPFTPEEIFDILEAAAGKNQEDTKTCVRRIRDRNLRSFIARTHRGGIGIKEILAELRGFIASNRQLHDLEGRLDFIDQLMRLLARKTHKDFWGGKAKAPLDSLHRRHPQAHFFFVLRDGRDILASRLNVGNFQTNARDCVQAWQEAVRKFQVFSRCSDTRAMILRYEDLVADPEAVLKECCKFIGIEYNPVMVRYEETELPLLKNPYGHLSATQIAKGLNNSSIGRWRHDLAPANVELFESLAHDLLAEFGYTH